LQISYDFKPRQICSKILDLLENDGADDMSEGAANTSLLTSLKSNLDLLQEERRTCEIQTKVLESLYFEEIDNRWETISEAASRTNAWLFDRTVTTFVDWLEDESGFYWITGLVRGETCSGSKVLIGLGRQWEVNPYEVRFRA
jgi:hypothetical protein